MGQTRRVKNEEVLQSVMEERRKGISDRRLKRRIIQVLSTNCLLKHVVEGKIEVTKRRRRRCKQLSLTVRKREDTGSLRRNNLISLTGNLALEEDTGQQLDYTIVTTTMMMTMMMISYRVACNNRRLFELPTAFLHLITIHHSHVFRCFYYVTITMYFTIVNT